MVYEIVALMVLIGAETFAMSLAILWSLSAIFGLGQGSLGGAVAASAVLAAGAAYWIMHKMRETAAKNVRGE